MEHEHAKHGVKGWEHKKMAEHEGGHTGSTDSGMSEMKKINEPEHHMGGMTIINHQDHQEPQHVHVVHHFGEHKG